MSGLCFKHRFLLLSFLIFSLIGVTVISFLPKMYLSRSHVVIFRPKIENPDFGTEESRNRWIWIRDGLNQKSSIVTDKVILKFISENNALVGGLNIKNKNDTLVEYLKGLITIKYTGADENNFILEVLAPDPVLAHELNKSIFSRIRYLATESYDVNYNIVLSELQKKQKEVSGDPTAFSFYTDKILKLMSGHVIDQKQRENSFEIISAPTMDTRPIKDKKFFILIAFSILGIVFGLFVEFGIFHFKRLR